MTGILTRLKFLEDDLFKNSFENEQVCGGGGDDSHRNQRKNNDGMATPILFKTF